MNTLIQKKDNMLSKEEIKKYLEELKIDSSNNEQIKLKDISIAFQKLAVVLHPDKAGEGSTSAFQNLRHAYEKLRDHFLSTSPQASESAAETNFFEFFKGKTCIGFCVGPCVSR